MGRGCPRWGWQGLEFGPAFEGLGVPELKRNSVSLSKEAKVGFRNAVVTAERALGLVPEVLDSIDVIVAIENVGVRVVDPVVTKLGDVEDS